MTTLIWTKDLFDKEEQKGSYMKINENKLTRRYLSGAYRSWNSKVPKDVEIIFVPRYRVAGTKNEIKVFLNKSNISKEDIESALMAAIEFNNRNDQSSLAYLEKDKREKKKSTENYNLNDIMWFAQNIKNAVTVKDIRVKESSPKKTEKNKKQPRKEKNTTNKKSKVRKTKSINIQL